MPSDAEFLKAYLADRDVPCPGCGYSLKGCVAEKCPECAAQIILQLTAPPRVLRWFWLLRAALLSFMLECGWLIYMTVPWVRSQGWTSGSTATPYRNFEWFFYIGSGALAGLLAIWLLARTFGPSTAFRSERIEKVAIGALALLVLADGGPSLLTIMGRLFGWY